MIRILSILALLGTTTAQADAIWSTGGFDMPESALVLPDTGQIVLSVIGGNPGAADGVGGLALLSSDGAVIAPDWVSGLDAPKGMALVGEVLLVADLTRVHVIDPATGAVRDSITVPGAVFLNDVTSDGTLAWITDLMGNTIWEYRDGAVTRWLSDPALSHPNGILFDGARLVVGSWGQGMHEDFSTDTPGALLAVDLDSQAISILAPGLGNIDGVARLGDELLANDWATGELFSVAPDGAVRSVMLQPAGLADISVHEGRLFLPLMLDGRVQVIGH